MALSVGGHHEGTRPVPRSTGSSLHRASTTSAVRVGRQQGRVLQSNEPERRVWKDAPSLDDCWGRSIWGLGTAAAHSDDELVRLSATDVLDRAMRHRSPWLKATAFAALGAAELLSVSPDHESAHALLLDAAHRMTRSKGSTDWPWPEARLTYANATLPEAMIAAGAALDRPSLTKRGMDLLDWLLERESHEGHLSVTLAGGSGPDDHGPGF